MHPHPACGPLPADVADSVVQLKFVPQASAEPERKFPVFLLEQHSGGKTDALNPVFKGRNRFSILNKSFLFRRQFHFSFILNIIYWMI